MDELLRPFEVMANLTGMVYKAPFIINGARTISDAELKTRGEGYHSALAALRRQADDCCSFAGAYY